MKSKPFDIRDWNTPPKNVETMTRPELVQELRKYVPTVLFHNTLRLPTSDLAGMLMTYRRGGKPFFYVDAFFSYTLA